MAPVFEEIEMQWKGSTYKVTPDMTLVNKVEQKHGIARLIARMEKDPPMGHYAEVLQIVLKHAGCKNITWDEAYAEVYSNEDSLMSVVTVLQAMMPKKLIQGNAEAPAEGAKKATNPPTSTGAGFTKSPSVDSESSPPSSGE